MQNQPESEMQKALPSTSAPLAWKFTNPDGTTRFILDDPQRVVAWRLAHEGEIVPLYAALTDQERVAALWAIASLETDSDPDGGQNKEAAGILRAMLDRMRKST